MNLTELFEKQRILDKKIEEKVQEFQPDFRMDSVETEMKLIFAIHVEFMELANEIQFFKYWKNHKNFNEERVLEEASDVLHCILSLANIRRYSKFIRNVDGIDSAEIKFYPIEELFDQFRRINFDSSGQTIQAISLLLSIIEKLGFSEERLREMYLFKNKVNLKRAESDY